MKPIHTTLGLLVATTLFTGCLGIDPIRTDAEYTPQPSTGQPAFKYGSEKDILYNHTETTPDGAVTTTDIKVLASAAAYADAERQAIQAETSRVNAELGLSAVQALLPLVAPAPLPVVE
jgi:hypothetical protein